MYPNYILVAVAQRGVFDPDYCYVALPLDAALVALVSAARDTARRFAQEWPGTRSAVVLADSFRGIAFGYPPSGADEICARADEIADGIPLPDHAFASFASASGTIVLAEVFLTVSPDSVKITAYGDAETPALENKGNLSRHFFPPQT